jgi:hypothetical protein
MSSSRCIFIIQTEPEKMKLSTLSHIMHSLPLLCCQYCHVDHVILICFPATSNLCMRCHVCCIHTHTHIFRLWVLKEGSSVLLENAAAICGADICILHVPLTQHW